MNKSQKIAIAMVVLIIASVGLSVYAVFDPAFNFGLGPPVTGNVIIALILSIVLLCFYRCIWAGTGEIRIGRTQIYKTNTSRIKIDERDRQIL